MVITNTNNNNNNNNNDNEQPQQKQEKKRISSLDIEDLQREDVDEEKNRKTNHQKKLKLLINNNHNNHNNNNNNNNHHNNNRINIKRPLSPVIPSNVVSFNNKIKLNFNKHNSMSEWENKSLTFQNQMKLSKLPLPELTPTLKKYLTLVKPLLNEEEFHVTESKVQDFQTRDGPVLQEMLKEMDTQRASYIEEYWNDSYLCPNASTVLNLNPFFVLEDDPNFLQSPSTPSALHSHGIGIGTGNSSSSSNSSSVNDNNMMIHHHHQNHQQTKRAASLVYSSLRFISAMRKGVLEPDSVRGIPLCMSQYRNLFGFARIPKIGRDEITIDRKAKHIVVICNNFFYYFNCLLDDGETVGISEDDIYQNLQAIIENSEEEIRRRKEAKTNRNNNNINNNNNDMDTMELTSVGVLTTEDRKEWAMIREKLCETNQQNIHSLHKIDSSLFVLCLDDTSPTTEAEIASQCLHGSYNYDPLKNTQVGTLCNRWYDKLQLICFKNGRAGVNFEHSAVDGHTVLRFVSDVFADTIIRFAKSITKSCYATEYISSIFKISDSFQAGKCQDIFPKRLGWVLNHDICKHIYFAETRISDQVLQHDIQSLEFMKYGKTFITSHKFSPDTFVQFSIVAAYYQLYGKIVCTYEPVQTKKYLHGRTEAQRTVTEELVEFIKLFCDKSVSNEKKIESFRKAVKRHTELVRDAAKGHGVDRHLFALHCLAKQHEQDFESSLGNFFEDTSWKKLNHTVLSTSNCGNPSLRQFGFGPVVPEGFGVGYIIKDSQLQYTIASKHRQTARFVGMIKKFLLEMHDILDTSTPILIKEEQSKLKKRQSSEILSGYGMFDSGTGELDIIRG